MDDALGQTPYSTVGIEAKVAEALELKAVFDDACNECLQRLQ
jgi:hypothetical protein